MQGFQTAKREDDKPAKTNAYRAKLTLGGTYAVFSTGTERRSLRD